MTKTKILICPYCGEGQPNADRCRSCSGLFEPLSRQATTNAMGPWFVRDSTKPFQPGCSYETLLRMIDRGTITKYTIIRGPTTRQMWSVAKRINGVAHLLGYCHQCDVSVDPGDHGCHACGVAFGAFLDRNYLGLPEIQPMPWDANLEDSSPGRLSRFASDEELLDPDGSRAGLLAPVSITAVAARHLSQTETHEVSETPSEDPIGGFAASTVNRTLQRRVAAQQRTNRLLVAAVILTAMIAIVTNVLPILDRFAAAPGDLLTEPSATGETVLSVTGEAGRTAAEDDATDADTATLESPAPASGPDEAAAVPTPPIDAPAPIDPARAALEEVTGNIVRARQTALGLDERINAYQAAIDGLHRIVLTAEPGGGAARADLLSRIRHEQDLLVLRRDFYGGGS